MLKNVYIYIREIEFFIKLSICRLLKKMFYESFLGTRAARAIFYVQVVDYRGSIESITPYHNQSTMAKVLMAQMFLQTHDAVNPGHQIQKANIGGSFYISSQLGYFSHR